MAAAEDQDELQTVEGNIKRLEETKYRLMRELRNIEEEIDTEKAKYAVLKNRQVPALQLPHELMSTVFRIVHDDSLASGARYGQRCLLSLARICSEWRHVVLTTSLLWNRISMSFGEGISPMNYVRLSAYLKRSGDCCLDMVFGFTRCHDSSYGFWDLIKGHSARWRRLSIHIAYAESTSFTTHYFHNLQTPALEHLSVNIKATQGGGPGTPRQNYSPGQGIKLHPPRLRFLRLAGAALGDMAVTSTSIQTLHLNGWARSFMTWKQLKDILEALPELKSLSLYKLCIRHPGAPLEGPEAISLPALECLRIHDPFTPVDAILPLLDMANLKHLFLQKVDSLQANTMPSLVGLHLEQVRLDAPYLELFTARAPNITTLSIDDCSYAALAETLWWSHEDDISQDTPTPWPRLRTLNVRQLSGIDVSHLIQFVLFRQTLTESRLDTLTLDRRSRTALRTKHRLDMLADQVGVQNHDLLEPWPPGLGYDDPHDLED